MKKEPMNIEALLESADTVSVEYDMDSFQAGVDKMSYFCGELAALINLGIEPDSALAYFKHKREARIGKEITEIETQGKIECVRAGLVNEAENEI